jgi:DUF4097 and DUF4098 domain-containing protein YvlB
MNTEERIEEEFAVGEAPQLSVSNIRGTIKVQGDNRDNIQVTAVKHVNDCAEPERTIIDIFQRGDHVVVKTRHRDKDRWLGRRREKQEVCAVDYIVRVPTSCELDVNQVNGTIHVSDVSGRVVVSAVKGKVELHEIVGRTRVKAVSASVAGDGWSGRARVNTVSGPVQIASAQLSRVNANTVSGALSLETTVDEDGHYDFHSVSGDVTLYLSSEGGVISRGTTISGQLVCDLPHEYSRRGHGRWQATINGGGPPVRFHSVSGDLEVLAAKQP